jgi:uroporphyrinogen-III decarboxylase
MGKPTMTRKERILAAISREPVDCVPHATYNIHPYAASIHSGEPSYRPILEKIAATAGAMIKVHGGGGWGPHPSRLEQRFEGSGDARIEHTTLHTPKGDLPMVGSVPENKPGMVSRHFVATDEDIEKYLSIPYEPVPVDLTAVRSLYAAVGNRAVLMVVYAEPMSAAASLFHFEDFTIRCLTDMPTIKRMIDHSFEPCLEYVRRLTEACRGMDVVLHASGPELCTPPMLPPSVFAELVTPYMAKIIDVIHGAGLRAAIHCHGRVREVLPEMLKTGCDLLEPIEPPPQGNITLKELIGQTEGRMSLMGYIQDQEFYTAQPGEMTRRVEGIAPVINGRTGYIMSPTCTPFDLPCTDVFRRNYMEWLDAAARILGV